MNFLQEQTGESNLDFYQDIYLVPENKQFQPIKNITTSDACGINNSVDLSCVLIGIKLHQIYM